MTRHIGTTLLNYRLVRELGAGGFGTVYLAEHIELGRKAACKVLNANLIGQADAVERFFREARAACAIGHPAIISIENFGRLDSGEPFFLMEFVAGESLARRIERSPLTLTEVLAVFDPIASALTAAHAAGIIHRDIKPDNIMVRLAHGRLVEVKLVDFGIAKLVASVHAVAALSQSSSGLGTPLYMSPEQARDASSVTEASDIYSFGATVYAALAGRPPFVADSLANLVLMIQLEQPPPLDRFAPHVPTKLASAIAGCLVKDPSRRPATIELAWRAIREAIAAATGATSSRGLAVTLDETTDRQGEPRAAPRSRRWLAAGLVVALAGGGAGVYWARQRSEPLPTPDAAVIVATDATAADVARTATSLDATGPTDASEVAIATPIDAGTRPVRPPGGRRDNPPPITRLPIGSGSGSDGRPVREPPLDPCDEARFRAVINQDSPREQDVQAALGALRSCEHALPAAKVTDLRAKLLRKL